MPSEQPEARVQTCLTCGTRVEVVSTDEGTHHYRPAEDERYGPTVAAEREQMQALIDHQAKALEAVAALDGGYPDDYCEIARDALARTTERTTDG